MCWQLPGNFKFDAARVEGFLKLLPRGIRQAIEVRSTTFADPVFIELLRAHNVALVIADTADWPYVDQTADFTYARLQGAPSKERYEPADLDAWAARFKALSEGKPIDGKTIVPVRRQAAATRRVRLFRLDRQTQRAGQCTGHPEAAQHYRCVRLITSTRAA